MSRPSGYRDRYRAAHHEAGHAVTAIVMGWPMRYVSLAPRRPDAVGHAVWAPHAWRLTRSGCWEPELMVCAAGMAAEDLAVGGDPARRRAMSRRNAQAGADLQMLRVGCRHVWHRIHNPEFYPGDAELSPPVDPAWTVADIAGHAWRRAVELVWERGPAVCEVADALRASTRALTQVDVRRIVSNAPLTTAEDDEEWGDALTDADLAFWPGQYSRLAWRPFPPSSCRTSGPGQRQATVAASRADAASPRGLRQHMATSRCPDKEPSMSRTSGHPNAQDPAGTREEQAADHNNEVIPFAQYGNAVTPSVAHRISREVADSPFAPTDHDCFDIMLSGLTPRPTATVVFGVNRWPSAAALGALASQDPTRCEVTVLHKTTRPGRRWRPGDELREVFTFTVQSAHPHRAAHVARTLALHLKLGCCKEHDDQAGAYQAAGLRPLQIGDVLLVSARHGGDVGRGGRMPLEVLGIGFHPFAAGYVPAFTPAASTTDDDIATVRLTPARRLGLAVLAAGHQQDRPVYESNHTSSAAADRLTVSWRTLDWLRGHGYVTRDRIGSHGGVQVYLTAQGLHLALQETTG